MFFPKSPLFDAADPDANLAGAGGDHGQPADDAAVNAGEPNGAPAAITMEGILAGLKGALPEMMKPLIGSEINSAIGRIDRELKAIKKAQAPATPAFSDDGNASPRERELAERVNRMEEERKQEMAALQGRELDAEIKASLSQLPFADNVGRTVAFDYYKAKAERNEDGELVIGEKPLSAYIAGHANQVFEKFMQRRDNVGGSGNATPRNAPVKGFGLDNIKAGMSPEEDKMARTALLAAYKNRG